MNDVHRGVSLARTRLNLANVIDEASADGLQPFVVSPPPSSDPGFNDRLRTVVDAERDVCERRSVPFVDCFTPLLAHEQWAADLAVGDGVHPGQAGYGLIAWLVLHYGWLDWLGVSPTT